MQIMLAAMSFKLEEFIRRRPFLYHLTTQSNIASIKSAGELYSATTLIQSAGRERSLRTKRAISVRLTVNGLVITLRDQEPLHAGNIQLQHGWTFGDIDEMLNNHVYFWPGDSRILTRFEPKSPSKFLAASEGLEPPAPSLGRRGICPN